MSVSPNLLAELLDAALHAARVGADVLTNGMSDSLRVEAKGEIGNLVTNIDMRAEEAVRSTIQSRRPHDMITGEELPPTSSSFAELRWSIDPLDGTTNYIRGIPYFATSVGVCDLETGVWLAGAVAAPELGKTYFASLGGGAWLMDRGGLRRLNGPLAENGARLLGMGYSYSSDIRNQQFASTAGMMAGFTDSRALGSAALAVCAVAEGALDAYYETDLEEYDWAAGALVAQEAGLSVSRPTESDPALSIARSQPTGM